jgi:hypothetical protein
MPVQLPTRGLWMLRLAGRVAPLQHAGGSPHNLNAALMEEPGLKEGLSQPFGMLDPLPPGLEENVTCRGASCGRVVALRGSTHDGGTAQSRDAGGRCAPLDHNGSWRGGVTRE